MNILEQLKSVLCDPSGKCCITGSDEDRAIVERALQALAEQPAQQEPVAWCVYCDGQFSHNIYRDEDLASFRAAALEQEYPRFKREVVPLYTAPPPCPTCEALARAVMLDQTSHDAPHIRDAQVGHKWVGLTDEELEELEVSSVDRKWGHLDASLLSRSIEAKLKDKNT